MTADQRIEKLLNRAGQTLAKDYATDYPHTEEFRKHMGEVVAKHGGWYRYALRMADIIDKLETALENVCGERDYLRSVVCGLCTNFREDGADACETCIVGDGVPEYWRADDEKGL